MPKPPPRLTCGGACAGLLGDRRGQRDRRALQLDQGVGVERLGAGEDMEAAPLGAGLDDPADQRGRAVMVDPERLGAPPIFMPEPLISNGGLTRTASLGGQPVPRADRQRPLGLAFGFEVEGDAGADRGLQLLRRACRARRS